MIHSEDAPTQSALIESLRACPIGVAIVSRDDGRRLFANQALLDMMGVDSFEEFMALDMEATWADPKALRRSWLAFQRDKSLQNFEAERVRSDGTRYWLLISTQPTTYGNEQADIVWHIDITDRKTAEETASKSDSQIRAAVESLSDGFALFDADDKLVFYNSMFQAMNPELVDEIKTGVRFEEMLRLNVSAGRILEAVGREDEYIAERMARHRNPNEPILSHRSNDRWLLVRELRGPDGITFLVNTDMTELKAREDALREAKERAEEINGYKSEFLATMSHELRTPLNAILAFSEIMRDELFGEIGGRYQQYAADIHTSGELLLELINDVLDISRIESGKHELTIADVDLGEIVSSATDALREQARSKGLELRTHISKSLPRCRADQRALRQILLNILSNAVKFTPENGRVRISATWSPERGVNLTVADTGIGIAEDDIPTILTPFKQLENRHGGTGLGLSIVHALVELHGGTLSIKSKVGEGTQVSVRLPKDCLVL